MVILLHISGNTTSRMFSFKRLLNLFTLNDQVQQRVLTFFSLFTSLRCRFVFFFTFLRVHFDISNLAQMLLYPTPMKIFDQNANIKIREEGGKNKIKIVWGDARRALCADIKIHLSLYTLSSLSIYWRIMQNFYWFDLRLLIRLHWLDVCFFTSQHCVRAALPYLSHLYSNRHAYFSKYIYPF